MEVEKLHIGDWISVGENQNYKVDGIHKEYNEWRVFLKETKVFTTEETISPIPLTPEILEKNGLKPFVAGQYILPMENKETFVCIAPMKGLPNANGKWLVGIKNGYTNAKIAITYVHELQQAFTLCGVDKKIEV